MMGDIVRGVAEAVVGLMVMVGVVCFAVGALLMWGLPKLWDWLKPLIHSLTA